VRRPSRSYKSRRAREARRTDEDLDVRLGRRVELLERLLDDLRVDVAGGALPARGRLVEDKVDLELLGLASSEVCSRGKRRVGDEVGCGEKRRARRERRGRTASAKALMRTRGRCRASERASTRCRRSASARSSP